MTKLKKLLSLWHDGMVICSGAFAVIAVIALWAAVAALPIIVAALVVKWLFF